MEKDHAHWMQQALHEAALALAHNDVPVGAVAVQGGQIIGRGHNERERRNDPTAHAEMIAMRQAADAIQDWRLTEVTMYCTLEPCIMCAGAMVQARLGRLVWATDDPKAGAAGSIMNLLDYPTMTHQVECIRGVLAEEAAAQLKSFFDGLR